MMTYEKAVLQSFNKGLRPDAIISVSDWADANRVLSQTASSEPGRFRTSRTPYLREILERLHLSTSQTIENYNGKYKR